jgi:hypothetical protein
MLSIIQACSHFHVIFGEYEFRGGRIHEFAYLDDQPLIQGNPGWVTNFHRVLQIRIGQDTVSERLRRVAALVAVLSPCYIRPDWTLLELTESFKDLTDSFIDPHGVRRPACTGNSSVVAWQAANHGSRWHGSLLSIRDGHHDSSNNGLPFRREKATPRQEDRQCSHL